MRIESNRTTFDGPWSNEPERVPPARPDRLALNVPDPSPARTARTAVDAASPLTAAETRDANAGARLDALRDRFCGPYRVDGQAVAARPMFRMNGGGNEHQAKAHASELYRIAARAGVNIEMVRLGQGKPEDLVKITQALIDAGKLPAAPPGDASVRVRQMQWEWGIGVDCAGYTYQAAAAASGASAQALGLKAPGYENFRGLDGNSHFKKIDPTLARPGDIMTLDPQPPETVGHNVIVRSHSMKGTVHTFEVDSSWGAGADGAEYGGFRRDTWSYDESTRLWTWTNNHVSPPMSESSFVGPAGDAFHGCYRPKVGQ